MDPRFKNVVSDPRFKPIYEKEVSINADDERFKNLTQSSTVRNDIDPRGRTFNPKKLLTKKLPVSVRNKKQRTVEIAEGESDSEEQESSEEEHNGEESDAEENEDSDDDESSENEKSDDSEVVVEYEDVPEDEDLLIRMKREMNASSNSVSVEPSTDSFQKRMALAKDTDVDYLRGGVEDDCSSSSDDSSSSDEEELTHDWAELDKDAEWDVDGHEVEETNRIAVCNLDWDKISVKDIFMLLNSFAPFGGKVTKVSIYMSEFGKQRLAEEETKGPTEVRQLPVRNEDNDGEERGIDHETIRKYHLNKLKYYYAVVECNTVDAAVAIYKSVDGTNFKNGGIIDLRYIPSDLGFDEAPESVCTGVETSYNPKSSINGFAEANLTNARYNWDEDKERPKVLQKFADSENAKDDPLLKDFLASGDSDTGSESEGEYESVYSSYFDSSERQSKRETAKKFRDFISTLDTVDTFKETEEKLLKRGMGQEEEEDQHVDKEEEFTSEEEDSEEEDDEMKGLTPFEKYLMKRRKKQKEYKKQKRDRERGGPGKPRESDWDIPDDLKNDPFFKQELELRRKEKLKEEEQGRKKKDEEFAQQELDKQQREKDMALLMLNDGDDALHINMRDVVKEAQSGGAPGGGRKKLSRWKLSRLKAKEKRLAREGVSLSSGVEEEEESAPSRMPAAPCQTGEILEDNRFSKITSSWKGSLERSHPEFYKHQTPFMEDLSSEFISKSLSKAHRKRRDSDFIVTEKEEEGKQSDQRRNKRKLTGNSEDLASPSPVKQKKTKRKSSL